MSTTLNFSSTKPQIPSLSPFHWWTRLRKNHHLLPSPPSKTLALTPSYPRNLPAITAQTVISQCHAFPLFQDEPLRARNPNPSPHPTRVCAGRSKKKPGGPSPGRIEGNAEIRRRAKEGARKRSRRLAENYFYRHNNPRNPNQADEFTEEELQMIGLGYDRMVRFMEKDDPNLRHPHDWYKYGRYGPYSWRGIVIGRPIRGRFTDERVTMIGEVRDHDEWEEIERFEMASDFTRRIKSMDETVGFRYFWVFVRHPKWKSTELPWQQWTLVSEVVLEAGKQRLDKWNLMGRLGNKARALITQCAAWMRPDIIYVRRPVYQCRFEPQDDFFKLLGPLIDPSTENQYLFELKDSEGRVEACTYFGGLCKLVKISPKAFVDDVTKAYEKLSDGGKSRCLEFLLTNHPMELLHPFTREWKAKLEEMELGCDAPDDDESYAEGANEITDWIEDDDIVSEDDDEEDTVVDVGEDGDDEEVLGKEEITSPEESEEYWNEQWKKAVRSSGAMEDLVKKSVEVSTEFYKKQMMEEQRINKLMMEELRMEGDANSEEQIKGEWKGTVHHGPKRRIKKNSKIPPELFLRAAVRPFTYRNLVKEIVLMRHAIIDGEISSKG